MRVSIDGMRGDRGPLGGSGRMLSHMQLRGAGRRLLSHGRGEGVGAPFMHAFNKTSPGKPPKVHVRGEGVYVYDQEGNKLLDALAGLWSVSLGYSQQRIVEAAGRQMSKLPYYHTFWNQGHDVGYELAAKLQDFIPCPVDKIAFTSGGSDANDTAIKLVWFYNNAMGRFGKKKIITRNKAYHGVTALAASLSGLPGESEEQFSMRLARELEERIVHEDPETVAAVMVEPLMGAGGVMPPPAGYLKRVREICSRYDVLMISDEVVCGFGRLGESFGFEKYGFVPDIITMAKALTSSYAPMGAVAVSPSVSKVLADGSDSSLLGHGYTFGAHPVSCAVALECMKIYEEENIKTNVQARAPELLNGLREVCKDSPIVGEVRGCGLIAAIELVKDRKSKAAFDASHGVGAFFCESARRHGVIVRAIGDVLACSPPLIITEQEVAEVLRGYQNALKDTEKMIIDRGIMQEGALRSSSVKLFDVSLQV